MLRISSAYIYQYQWATCIKDDPRRLCVVQKDVRGSDSIQDASREKISTACSCKRIDLALEECSMALFATDFTKPMTAKTVSNPPILEIGMRGAWSYGAMQNKALVPSVLIWHGGVQTGKRAETPNPRMRWGDSVPKYDFQIARTKREFYQQEPVTPAYKNLVQMMKFKGYMYRWLHVSDTIDQA